MVDRMRIAEAKSDPGRSHAASGRTLEEIAAESGINPLDLLRDERFMIGLSDGAPADLVLFDPDTVGANEREYVHDLPGGCRRFMATATGLEATIVAGQELYRDGEYPGGLPGEVLRNRS